MEGFLRLNGALTIDGTTVVLIGKDYQAELWQIRGDTKETRANNTPYNRFSSATFDPQLRFCSDQLWVQWGNRIAPLRREGLWYKLGKTRRGVAHDVCDDGRVVSVSEIHRITNRRLVCLEVQREKRWLPSKKVKVPDWTPYQVIVVGDVVAVLVADAAKHDRAALLGFRLPDLAPIWNRSRPM